MEDDTTGRREDQVKREPWLRFYNGVYYKHVEVLPCVGLSWDSGYICIDVSWLLWTVELQWSQRRIK